MQPIRPYIRENKSNDEIMAKFFMVCLDTNLDMVRVRNF
jgi:hypothetical protein